MSLVVYAAAALLIVAALVVRRAPRAPRTSLTVASRATAFIGAICFTCAAPATLAAVNRATGIPNFGAPLTYSFISAFSCSLIILLILWRGGPHDRIRRMIRLSIAVYGALIVAINLLFVLAHADTERLRDLDTYYANTPYMREMIVLYLMGHLASTIVLSVVCLKWARDEVTGLLRIGLRLILSGLLLDVIGFELTKVTAVIARWCGYNLDFLSTTVAPPAASVGALIYSAGFVLPRLASAVSERQCLTSYRALLPLWATLKDITSTPRSVQRWQLPSSRLYLLEAQIHDALLDLTAHFDRSVGEAAYRAALETGKSPEEARIASEKALVIDGILRASGQAAGAADPPDEFRLTVDLVELAQSVSRIHAVTPDHERAH